MANIATCGLLTTLPSGMQLTVTGGSLLMDTLWMEPRHVTRKTATELWFIHFKLTYGGTRQLLLTAQQNGPAVCICSVLCIPS